MKLNRRQAITTLASALPVAKALDGNAQESRSPEATGAPLKWLESAPRRACGVSWGVPWARGAIQKGAGFHLSDSAGQSIPVQSWTLAYWPDGSIKWTGFAAVMQSGSAGPFT